MEYKSMNMTEGFRAIFPSDPLLEGTSHGSNIGENTKEEGAPALGVALDFGGLCTESLASQVFDTSCEQTQPAGRSLLGIEIGERLSTCTSLHSCNIHSI